MFKIKKSSSRCVSCLLMAILLPGALLGQQYEGSESTAQQGTTRGFYYQSMEGSAFGMSVAITTGFLIKMLDGRGRSPGDAALATMDCCTYPLLALSTPIGSTVMLLMHPNRPVKSVPQALLLFSIAGSEMFLYHSIAGHNYSDNQALAHRNALLGALFISAVIIPASQLLYLNHLNKDRNFGARDALMDSPKSVGLLSFERTGVSIRNPGLWMASQDESKNIWSFQRPGRAYFLSLASLNF